MDVQVRCNQVRPGKTARRTEAGPVLGNQKRRLARLRGISRFHARKMEFVSTQGFTGLAQYAVHQSGRFDIADCLQPLRHQAVFANQSDHRVLVALKISHTAAEIHITAALRDYRNALSGRGADSVKHRLIISQLLQKHLRKSATEQQSVNRRQRSVAQRTERYQFGAHFLQYPQTFRIIKRKSFIFGHADLHLARSRQHRSLRHGEFRRLAC